MNMCVGEWMTFEWSMGLEKRYMNAVYLQFEYCLNIWLSWWMFWAKMQQMIENS